MRLVVANILETIFNPTSRFKTINLEAAGLDDSVVRSFSRGVLEVDVIVDHEPKVLSCCVDTSKSICEDAKNRINDLRGVDTRWLAAVDVFESEMLVFDESGDCHYLDIMLKDKVNGLSLASELMNAYASRDAESYDRLRRSYSELLCSFISSSGAKFKLRPSDIKVVGSDLRLKVVGYRRGVHLAKDYIAYTLMLLVMRSNLPLRISFGSINIFTNHILRDYLPVLKEIAEQRRIPSIDIACELLSGENINILDSQLCDLLLELSTVDLNLENLDGWNLDAHKPSALNLSSLLRDYDYFGRLECGMIAVEKDSRWGYVNDRGELCVDLDFDWVDDFACGYAVVMKDDMYGLMDSTGGIVIPMIYESLEWDSDSEVVVASLEGYFGVLDVHGEQLVAFKYHWIGALSCGLMPAMLDDKYGYIDSKGNVVLDFIYDDAYEFRDGVARVVIGREELYINRDGS